MLLEKALQHTTEHTHREAPQCKEGEKKDPRDPKALGYRHADQYISARTLAKAVT